MSKEIPTIPSTELSELMGKKRFSGNEITESLNYLLGRVLTIIDASISESKQNKAVKDLIKGEFIWDMSTISDKLCNGRIVEVNEEELNQCKEVNPLDVVGN